MAGWGAAEWVWMAGLAAALAYLPVCRASPSAGRSLLKTAATGALALAALLWSAPPVLVLALGLGALGDLALSRPGERAFLAGLGAFLLAHLLYGWLLLEGPRADISGPRLAAMAALAALALGLGWRLFRSAGSLRWPVAVYVAVIAAMGLAALGSALPLAVLGALLFVASDAVLGVETFLMPPGSRARDWTGPLLWALYWAAQASLLAAFV